MTDRKIMKAIKNKTFFVHYLISEHRHRILGEYANHEQALAAAKIFASKYKAKHKPGVIAIYTCSNRWGIPGFEVYERFFLEKD